MCNAIVCLCKEDYKDLIKHWVDMGRAGVMFASPAIGPGKEAQVKTIFIKKANVHVDLEDDKIAWYMDRAAWRGFKEVLQDSVAGAKNEDEAEGMLRKCIGKLEDGTYSSHERGTSDPIGKEVERIALIRFKAMQREAGATAKVNDPAFKAGLARYIEANTDELRERAEAIIKLREGAPDA